MQGLGSGFYFSKRINYAHCENLKHIYNEIAINN